MLLNNFKQKTIHVALLLGFCSLCMVFLHFTAVFPFVIIFASIPLMLSYLAYGKYCGNVSFMLSSFVVFFLYPIGVSVDIFLNTYAPAAVLGSLSIKNTTYKQKVWWYPEYKILELFMLFSVISVVFLSVTIYDEQSLTKAYDKAISFFQSSNLNEIMLRNHINSIVKYSAGLCVLTKMLLTLLNFQIAHSISKHLKMSIRSVFDITNIRLNYWMTLLPLISLSASFFINKLSFLLGGLFVVGMFAPIINGISIIHCCYNKSHKRRILIAFYLALLMFPLQVILVVSLLGIVDGIFFIRKKYINSTVF